MVCCRYIRFQKWFDVDVLDFQIELCCGYFGLFRLGDFLGYSPKDRRIGDYSIGLTIPGNLVCPNKRQTHDDNPVCRMC
jgi:hypothetical protein